LTGFAGLSGFGFLVGPFRISSSFQLVWVSVLVSVFVISFRRYNNARPEQSIHLFLVGTPRKHKAERDLVRVATFNINNINKRLDNLLAWLSKAEPDVPSMKEVDEFCPVHSRILREKKIP
jgi:hypothetical protein